MSQDTPAITQDQATETAEVVEVVDTTPVEAAAPPAEGVDLDTAIANFKARMSAGEDPAEAATEAVKETEESPAEAEAEASAEEPEEEAALLPDAEAEPPLKARQLAVLQRRESELSAREQAIKELETNLGDVKQMLRTDPVQVLKNLGIEDAAEVAKAIWFQQMGDDAPEEFRQQRQQQTTEQRLSALEQENAELKAQAARPANEPAIIALANDLQALSEAVPADKYPYLSREAQADSQEILNALGALGQSYLDQGLTPSASELAAELEASIAEQVNRHAPAPAPAADTAPDSTPETARAATRQPPKTLSDADTNQTPNREPEGLLSDEEYQRRGMAAFRKYSSKS